MNNFPVFFKTSYGSIINLSMITQMYKRSDNQCIIEFVNGNVCQIQISQEDFERIYNEFTTNLLLQICIVLH